MSLRSRRQRRNADCAYLAAEDRVAAVWPELGREADPQARARILHQIADCLDGMVDSAGTMQLATAVQNTADVVRWLAVTEAIAADSSDDRPGLLDVLGANRYPTPWPGILPVLHALCDTTCRPQRAYLIGQLRRAATARHTPTPTVHVFEQIADAYRLATWQ